tara:strand:+ start:433 stop:660 length:228 start_codon:yes stop_codon:yes gene_type:complete
MYSKIKEISSNLLVNCFILIFLFILLQNAKNKSSVNFLNFKSVEVPIGLITGFSFIAGSSTSNILLSLNKSNKKI